MKKLLVLLVGLLLFLSLAYFCIYIFSAQKIEADIKSKAEDSLMRNSLSSVQVGADGLDLTLRGVVASDVLKAKAERVAAVDGYHKINNLIEVAKEQAPPKPAYIEPYSMLIKLKDDKSIILSGSVPSLQAKNNLLSLANSRYGKPHVTDDLTIKTKAPANWERLFTSVFEVFPLMKNAQLEVLGQQLQLSGLAKTEVIRQEIGESLEENLPKNYLGSLNISLISKDDNVPDLSPENTQAAKNCQQEFKSLLSKNKIHFKTGKAEVAKSSFKLLDSLASTAKGCSKQMIVVAGHTDSKGSEKNNKILSEKRAKVIVNYLQKKGINKGNLKAKGYGEEKPVATNKTSKGRALNRRIEFTVEGVK
ncbi:MAG TPA: BON domain-containing protein [Leucothrix mucor]|nr:BON domain-containing protein [Leucothrix mucor]